MGILKQPVPYYFRFSPKFWIYQLALYSLAGLILLLPGIARASGNVTDCINYSSPGGLGTALAAGGNVTFSCDGTILIPATIAVNSTVTIDATGHNVTLDAHNAFQLFNVAAAGNLTLTNLTLTNGKAVSSNGGAIISSGALTITNSAFTNNLAIGTNGVVGIGGSSSACNGGTGAKGGEVNGGAIYSSGSLTISNSTFTRNTTQGGNGGSGQTLTVTCTDGNGINGGNGGNGGAANGGAIYATGTAFNITRTTFSNNRAVAGSGGNGGVGSNSTSYGGTGGTGGNGANGAGGAIFVSASSINIRNNTFTSNSAIGGSGGNGGQGGNGPTNPPAGMPYGPGAGGGGNGGNGAAATGGAVSIISTSSIVSGNNFALNSATSGVAGALGPIGAIGAPNRSPGVAGSSASSNGGGLNLIVGTINLNNGIFTSNTPNNCAGVATLATTNIKEYPAPATCGLGSIVTNDKLYPFATSISLALAPGSNLTQGQVVTFNATLSNLEEESHGLVTFSDGTTVLGTAPLIGNTASFSTSNLSVGVHSITASFGGEEDYSSSTSPVLSITISPATPTVTLASSLATATYGQAVTFTANVTAGGIAPTGSVTFYDSTTSLGTVPLSAGSASLTISTLGAGNHPITATYSGDSTYSSSTSTVLTQPVSQATATITLANLSQTYDGTAKSVTYTTSVAVQNVQITYSQNNTAVQTPINAGDYQVTATISDPNYTGSSSATLTIAPATSSITLVSSLNPAKIWQTVTFTATISPAIATGSVTFYDGATTLGIGNINSGGQATLATSPLVVGGIHLITAAYNGSNNVNSSTSASLSQEAVDGWAGAKEIPLSPVDLNTVTGSANQTNTVAVDSQWFSIQVPANGKITVTLRGAGTTLDLPYDMDLTLHKDVKAEYDGLNNASNTATTPVNPVLQTAKVAAMESLPMWTWEMWTFPMWTWEMWTFPMWTWEMWTFPSPTTNSVFTPDTNVPSGYNAVPYIGAQKTSLVAASAQTGNMPELVVNQTGNNSGTYYLRVKSKNGGVGNTSYHIDVKVEGRNCEGFTASTPPSYTNTQANTVVVTDYSQLPGTADEKTALQAKLTQFVARSEVGGVVVDLSANKSVQDARAKANQFAFCPLAQNALAAEIKSVVSSYKPRYIVLIGADDVIPFYRYLDQAAIGKESNYIPPVDGNKPAGVALQDNMVLGQDYYGQSLEFNPGNQAVPIPDVAVGRLVSTAADATNMITQYLNTKGVIAPKSGLVTGYDFATDTANLVKSDLTAAMTQPNCGTATTAPCPVVDSLISDTWSANDLRAKFINTQHDFIFLGGHFSAGGTEAADKSVLMAAELLNSSTDQSNSLLLSIGCHSGYNIPLNGFINNYSPDPDWAKAFARKGMTSVIGTGYQYGDTDVIAYSEKLYSDLVKQLHTGTGQTQITIGDALVATKKHYLATNSPIQGVHAKVVIEATLYGLPMLGVQLTGTTPASDTPVSLTLNAANSNLNYADYNTGQITTDTHTVTLANNANQSQTVTATYRSGKDGTVTNPLEPVLPLDMRNVTVSGQLLRGVGFRKGDYVDTTGLFPLVSSAPTTEQGLAHPTFSSNYFYPVTVARPNYYDALSDGATTRLAITPVQYKSDSLSSITGTQRLYNNLGFRLYYGSTNGLASPPAISGVSGANNNGSLSFSAKVVGQPDIQEVWITYTSNAGAWYGKWDSVNLQRSATDPTLWVSDPNNPLTLVGQASDLRFMVQATTVDGLVSLDTNGGIYYSINGGQTAQNTTITVQNLPASVATQSQPTLQATLKDNNQNPLAGKTLVFNLGQQFVAATTNANGVALVTPPAPNTTVDPTKPSFLINQTPGTYIANVYFTGDESYQASSSTSQQLVITKQATQLSLTAPASLQYGNIGNSVSATLKDGNNKPVQQKSILFKVTSGTLSFAKAVSTGVDGKATLGITQWPAGDYTLTASFGVLDNGQISDQFYNSSSASVALHIDPTPLTIQTVDSNRVYGQDNLPFQVTYTGLIPGETANVLGGTLAFTTVAGATSVPGVYSVTPSGLTSSNYAITFLPGNLTVNKASSSVVASVIATGTTFGSNVVFNVTVNPVAPGSGVPTGNITLLEGTTVIATSTNLDSSGKVTITVNTLSAGSHKINVLYNGDGNFLTDTATLDQAISINKASSVLTVTSSVSPSAFLNQPITFVATVAPTTTTQVSPTGSVIIREGSTILSTVTLIGGKASFTTATLKVGLHNITVDYNGDTNYQGSSATLDQKVRYRVCVNPMDDSDNDNPVTCNTSYTKAKKAGSTLPIKVQLRDFNNVNVSSATIVLKAVDVDGAPVSSSGKANPNNLFQWDRDAKRYEFSLKTTGLTKGSHTLKFQVVGDTNIDYLVQFTLN
ncbi:MAG: Ig-like domain repeat protein [Chloroflexi bacterium]|uniref:Ig-like domain repeat protein n=1 Tax=Candidatus Chlorohelix allophototropha TaxID=3003348 RepID=A0A8T7M149_9CHLR|nr:Ig-like domain repeat protein [Chloroflexota bacterium]WJW67156.1 Ig-like domain repeat protein [Chloroflexota bacterium L227-S17]